jgi:hypothetical protein
MDSDGHNNGSLSRHRRAGEFSQLRDDEVRLAEGIVGDVFAGFGDAPGELRTIPSNG